MSAHYLIGLCMFWGLIESAYISINLDIAFLCDESSVHLFVFRFQPIQNRLLTYLKKQMNRSCHFLRPRCALRSIHPIFCRQPSQEPALMSLPILERYDSHHFEISSASTGILNNMYWPVFFP